MESTTDQNGTYPNSNGGRITWEGCNVLLDINDGDRLVFSRLSPNATVKIGDKKLPLSPLVGRPFGSLFQVQVGPDGPYLAPSRGEDLKGNKENGSAREECSKDNRALVDNNSAQGLTGDDIEAMRREGVTGSEIIEALIANSATFENKTVQSQEKYILRKQKKYAPKVLLRRPFTRSICEAYFQKHPTRIGYLRVDTLSLLLSMANISAYSHVLLVDRIEGILTGAVAERLGSTGTGTGNICSTYFGTKPHPLNIVKIFNFNDDICSRILQAPFSILSAGQGENHSQCMETQENSDEACLSREPISSGNSMTSLKELLPEKVCPDSLDESPVGCQDESQVNKPSCSPRVQKPVTPGREASTDIINLWKERGFTSLIIAAPEMDTEIIIQELLPLLAYSAPFAIYHQYLQPLATCMHKLQTAKVALGLQITEPWLREYQVLPSRTHPHMQMSSSGGYILSGIKTCTTRAS